MNNRIFDPEAILLRLRKFGKILLCLIVTMLIGALIGCTVASGNPFAIFFPSTWIHFFEFLN
ncbi:DNA-directed RNA polymerase subunit beta [Lactobacillus hominis]|uniref:DNA-directed RNA polymerase subunit beta n=1 Tax=Lactobacillus hominis DSM 23910 = CRBIP 24.179 TaxID=1423758 RepID=I7KG14_9LACO|nr:DNA-directed RNA polymerase subunit beta [Lactobacillus hominis]MCT3348606.1 DNA-directed RNA polymerase subunit beta [Lactobacillus hominis]CCI80870.1 Putative uncharacterized protein [Lactobacillus hominis DSM 23910 = CRBIP 24.179]